MGLILLPILGSMNVMIARNKGYNSLLWFFCAGLLGLFVLIFLPNTKNEELEEVEVERLRRRGNNIGAGILVGAGILMFVVFTIALSA